MYLCFTVSQLFFIRIHIPCMIGDMFHSWIIWTTQANKQSHVPNSSVRLTYYIDRMLFLPSASLVDSSAPLFTVQELEHQRGVLMNEIQAAKNSWLSKTLGSLKSSASSSSSSTSQTPSSPKEGPA